METFIHGYIKRSNTFSLRTIKTLNSSDFMPKIVPDIQKGRDHDPFSENRHTPKARMELALENRAFLSAVIAVEQKTTFALLAFAFLKTIQIV